MKNLELVQGLGYEVEVRSELVILSCGTPENGETIELDNFNSTATSGKASHYCNGRESIYGWEIYRNCLKLLYD